MLRIASSVLSPALLAATAAAQTDVVFPSDHEPPQAGQTHREGYSYQASFPFSYGVSRNQALYESFDLNIPNGRQITHVGFPRDGQRSSTGESVQLEILMGHSQKDVTSTSATFADNYEGNPTTVLAKQVFKLPDLGAGSDTIWLRLDTPFTHDSSRNLVVEYRVFANSNANRSFNYYLDFGRFQSEVTSHGAGCLNSAGRRATLTSQRTAIGQNWSMSLRDAPASSNVALLVDLAPLPTPFQVPGTNCMLQLVGLISVPTTTNTGGAFNFTFPVPNNRRLVRGHLFSQAVIDDVFANSTGLVLSNMDEVEIGIRPLMTLVRSSGSATATTGSVLRNYGAISLFRYR